MTYPDNSWAAVRPATCPSCQVLFVHIPRHEFLDHATKCDGTVPNYVRHEPSQGIDLRPVPPDEQRNLGPDNRPDHWPWPVNFYLWRCCECQQLFDLDDKPANMAHWDRCSNLPSFQFRMLDPTLADLDRLLDLVPDVGADA